MNTCKCGRIHDGNDTLCFECLLIFCQGCGESYDEGHDGICAECHEADEIRAEDDREYERMIMESIERD